MTPHEQIKSLERAIASLRKRYPFHAVTPAFPNGAGHCPQCDVFCIVSDIPALMGRAPSVYAARCYGCQYANDAYWYSILAHDVPGRVYRYDGPKMTFAIWADTWR